MIPRYSVSGEDVKTYIPDAPVIADHVDEITPPCFLFHTRNDSVVPVKDTVDFKGALIARKISFESHIDSHCPHGIATADSPAQLPCDNLGSRAQEWIPDSVIHDLNERLHRIPAL